MNDGSAVPGGNLLYSPEARTTAGRLASVHMLAVAAVIALVAWDANHFDSVTIGYLIAVAIWMPIMAVVPWASVSYRLMSKIYFLGAGSFLFFAFHFDNPYLLLGVYPEAVSFADIYWYRRSLLLLHEAGLFAAFTVGALLVDNGSAAAELIIVAMPVMLASAISVGAVSSHFIRALLERTQFQSTVTSLLEALHARDGYTGDHSKETLAMALAVADELRLDDVQRKELSDVALLHDIGKIGIPNSILQKPGGLTAEEWKVMEQHPVVGEQILCDIPGFESVAKAVRHEHERWDGGGYPDGISAEEIPLASRIVLACDAFHAMTSDRPYRAAMPLIEARAELARNAGLQFDPDVIDALQRAIESAAGDHEIEVEEEADGASVRALVAAPAEFQAPLTASDGQTARRDLLNDPKMMGTVSCLSWSLIAIVTTAFLAATSFDWSDIAFLGFAVAVAVGSIAIRSTKFAPHWCLATCLIGYIAVPLIAWESDQPVLLVLLVLTASVISGFFWANKLIRAVQVALVILAFVLLPVTLFGSSMIAFTAVATRAFPGVLLVIGWFMGQLTEMCFERERFSSTISSLLLALHARDGYTGQHSDETVELAMDVAEQMHLTEAERLELRDVALLHDIGKIGIPDEVLNKPGKLSEDEWKIMRQHPVIGEQIVEQVPGFDSIALAIRHEHERWDGGGYPDGLAGEAIPLASRIVLACDAYNAMTTDRPYRKSLGEAAAREELVRCAGTQFDPRVVSALLAALDAAGIARVSEVDRTLLGATA
ncbi:MAG: HD-GYP domain-containing protein [Solirubrobacterales bacterium]